MRVRIADLPSRTPKATENRGSKDLLSLHPSNTDTSFYRPSHGSARTLGSSTLGESPGPNSLSVGMPASAANSGPSPSAHNSSTAPVSTHPSSISMLNLPNNRILIPDLLVSNGLSSNGNRSMEMILGGGQELEGLSELDNSCTFLEVADIGLYEQQEWWNFASADLVQVMDANTPALPIGSS
ncbi:hypothetical protein CKAH01_18986 [Colletotrichum kahawae]|uniref:Uncharacterized protein n=1 Tax=Colletotrichum kahawae TaxID=34407 RepID=A0AAD9Y4D7_COLKA|nr:hypothetical protein CKAH01_18986 [Colletotrichum kahawae]